jgi:hypothetical protein
MAKVIAPLMSQSASGPIGRITFISDRGRTRVGPNSCNHHGRGQTSTNARAFFESVISDWNSMDSTTKSTWINAATPDRNPFQLYLQTRTLYDHLGEAIPPPGLQADDGLKNLEITSLWPDDTGWPPAFSWESTTEPVGIVSAYAAPSFLHRSSISSRKHTWVSSVDTSWGEIDLIIPAIAPWYSIRILLTDRNSMRTISDQFFILHPGAG